MNTFISTSLGMNLVIGSLPTVAKGTIIPIALWLTGFLCLLNVVLAFLYRRRQSREVISYYVACAIELAIFIFAFLMLLNVIAAPFHLPPGLQVNQGEIGAALAVGIGLFPAAYWHRVNLSELPRRLAADAKVLKDQDGAVRVRKSTPGEWMN